jgi:predicted transcriptional regulator
MANVADESLKELVTIRKLLVLGLLRDGLSQKQLGAALDLDQSQVSRMFPSGSLKDLSKSRIASD